MRRIVLRARRLVDRRRSGLGYAYYALSGGSTALAAIGLISFVGVAQILPAMLGGIFWRGATRAGAAMGLVIGFVVWAYTLFPAVFRAGCRDFGAGFCRRPLGIGWLRPQALFGVAGMDPLIHAMFWSMVLNTLAFSIGSILTFPGPVERVQGAAFVNVFDADAVGPGGLVAAAVGPRGAADHGAAHFGRRRGTVAV